MFKFSFIIVLSAASAFAWHPLSAKEIPEGFDFDETQQVASASNSAKLKNLGDARYAPISMRQANRISVKNGRILRFVSDPQAIDIKHDEPTGSLFVISLTRESTNLFVMTESGQTHSLVLTPSEKLSGQNLEIEEARSMTSSAHSSSSAPSLPSEEKIQELFRNLTSVIREPSKNLSLSKMKRGSLEAVPNKYWETAALRLELWTLQNIGKSSQPIEESRFWQKNVMAAAVDKASLSPKEKTDLWIVRAGDYQ